MLVAVTVPATYKLPPMPTPPTTCRAPVFVLPVFDVLFATCIEPVLKSPYVALVIIPLTSVESLKNSNFLELFVNNNNAFLSVPLL